MPTRRGPAASLGRAGGTARVGRRISDLDPYRIALCVPTSGTAGLWGASSLACARLAVEEWNRDGGLRGREVRIHVIDASDESPDVEADLAGLVEDSGVDAIVGMHTSSVRERIGERGPRVPFVYTPLYEGGPLASHVCAIGETPGMQLMPALDWMLERWRLGRWFLVGNDYLWPRRTHALARRRLLERGCEVVGDAFVPLGRCDPDRLVDAIRASGAQAVLMSLVGQDAIDFGRAFSDSGLAQRVPRLGCAVEENGLLAMGADSSEGLFVASGYFAGLPTDRNGAFRERYWTRFGDRAPVLNALGQSTYEGVAFLRGLLDGGRNADGSVRFDSVRGTRWRSNERKSTPVYLAAAEGLGFGIVQTFPAA
ncbi:MAG: substrate-binding domain-containing protein [Burkholderiales bacterium]